ncbi:MAG: deoxynucleoside kinase [Rhodothermales bacterium]
MQDEFPEGPSDTAITLRDDLRYIVIEGVIGAGKTSLSQMLAEKFNGQLVLEEFEENPFLSRFYENPKRWGFHTQLSFLASRFQQQRMVHDRSLFHHVVVSDYIFEKDRIFAHLNLKNEELQLYETLFRQMEISTPRPDLVVYLQSSTDRLMQNIKKRERSFEKQMSRKYIDELNEAYNYYFFRFEKSPLLIINTTNLDFVEKPDDFNELARQIASVKHPGTTYFNPGQAE